MCSLVFFFECVVGFVLFFFREKEFKKKSEEEKKEKQEPRKINSRGYAKQTWT